MSNQREHRETVSPSLASPIAVVGVSALFPGSTDVRGFWRSIVEGRNQIKEIPPNYWLIDDYYDPDPAAPDKTYGKTGAFLSEVPFDAMAYGVPPNIVQQTDTSQLLGLIVAQQVLEDAAGGDFQHIDKSRISVILGATGATELVVHLGSRLQRPIWLNALRANGIPEDEAQAVCDRIADSYVPWTEASFPGLLGNVIAGRIANKFDLGGTNCVVDAACASSLSALSMGLSELYLHQADMAIVGGVDTLNDILMYMCFSKTPALSASGDCRPFSDQADGTILGEGLGMLALRRLDDAERDGDRIYAVVRGLGSSSDGKGTAVYAPKASGQAHALRRAYAAAGYSPRTVELLEAHGTATKAGDVAEFTGAGSVFAEADSDDRQWCAIGSIKSQIGHTKGAAGAASLIKTVLALHHKVLPPTIKVDRPNPNLAVDESPFYLNTEARPWVRDSRHPRRASVSSFGFGGSNFHVTLEEYTGPGGRKDEFRPSPTELFLASGADVSEFLAAARQLTTGFDEADSFQYLARSSQLSFQSDNRLRLGVVARDIDDLRAALDTAIAAIESDPAKARQSPSGWFYSGDGTSSQDGRLAFLFPGQGSQYVGMGADLALTFAESRAIWDEAANLEFEQEGRLHEIVYPRPVFTDEERVTQEARLRATEWAQPAIGAASLSLLALLSKLGITADAVGGHSFGEVTALHAAGAFARKAFFAVARKRGELMAEAAAMFPGAMTAISHKDEEVVSLLAGWNTGVVVANHNGPDQVVISGIESAIQATEEKLQQAAIRFQRLSVSTAFHSAIVRPAAAPFRVFLDHITVDQPLMPVYANSMAAVYSNVPDAIRETLAGQIAEPVRFAEQVEAMYAAGVRTFVEVGPSTVLTNLVKSCLKDRPHDAIALDRKGRHGLTSLWQGLAQIAVAGIPVALERLWEGVACGNDPRSRIAPKLAVNLSGVNHAKPYPPAGGANGLAAPNPVRNGQTPLTSNQQPKPGGSSGINGRVTEQSMAVPAAAPAIPVPHAAEATITAQSSVMTSQQSPSADLTVSSAAAIPAAPTPGRPAVAPTAPSPSPSATLHPAASTIHAGESLAWVQAFQTLQQQTADAHMAFLQVAEQSMRSLEAMLLPGVVADDPRPAPAPSADVQTPTHVNNGRLSTSYAAPTPAPAAKHDLTPAAPALPAASPAATQNGAVSQAARPEMAPPPTALPPTQDLHGEMMAVVTEKTGYPTEMLEPGMALDTDLGIDSIKRVEILAAMRERVPELPEFDTNVMAGLRTLGEIVAYMDSQLDRSPAATQNGAVSQAARPEMAPPPTALPPTQDLHAEMMAVVTEKTGYPTEMLEPGMALDTDLGIDSIKRVEILAAMRERVPELPEFDTNVMAGLRTLGEIVAYMDSQLDRSPAATQNGQLVTKNELGASLNGLEVPDRASPMVTDRIRRYVLEATPRPAPGLAPPYLVDGTTVYITDDGAGIAPLLAEHLTRAGARATVTTAVPADARAVICLAGLRPVGDVDGALAANEESFRIATTIAATFEDDGGLFVTVQDTGGDFGLDSTSGDRAWMGGLSGLAKTAAQEWPKAVVRAIDLAASQLSPAVAAERLAEELLSGGADREIGLAKGGTRCGFVSIEREAAGGAGMVTPESVLVISGGGRGVTAAAVIELAARTHARIALLGRSVLEEEPATLRAITDDAGLKKALLASAQAEGRRLTPRELGAAANRILAAREIRATLKALQSAGSEALYLSCDITDPAATVAALEQVRAMWGPITGIVHGAGVLADKRLAEKSVDDFQWVFGTKVDGLRSLLAATTEDPLSVVCLFSSVAARTGNAGQSDYAMANEVLNRVANDLAKQRSGCVVKSIGWGPWEGGMVTPILQAKFDELGVPLIPLASGARRFVEELQLATPVEVEVVIGGMPQEAPLIDPLQAQSVRAATYDVVVSATRNPYLHSHAIDGVVVVPLVLVQEWFLRAANARAGRPVYGAVQKLRVLKGMPLPGFSEHPSRLRICVEPENSDIRTLNATLYDADGVVRFAAQVVPSLEPQTPPVSGENWPGTSMAGADLYGSQLFHGPAFSTLQRVDRLGENGARAELTDSRRVGWQSDGWRSDPALIDGGLQLARVWGYTQLKQLTLPTAVEAFAVHEPGLLSSDRRVHCIVEGRPIGQSGTRTNLWFVDEHSGATIAEVRGLEMYVSSEAPPAGDAE